MNIIYRPRQSGKTTAMIERAAKDWLYIVCLSRRECDRVEKQATSMRLRIPFPITVDEFIDGRFSASGIKGFLVDDAEVVIQRLARSVPVVAISLTRELKERSHYEIPEETE